MSIKTDNIETEAKLYLPDLSAVAQKLVRVGATLVKPRIFERNVRYENAGQSLTEQGIIVRLRQDSTVRLTYKGRSNIPVQDGISSRFEAEVEVSDFDTMSLILDRLGYFPHVIYEKWRATYQLNPVEVVLDELPFGNFVEIEGQADDIRQAITRLGLEDAPRFAISYLELFDHVKRTLDLDFQDLTFDNFHEITVSEQVFLTLP